MKKPFENDTKNLVKKLAKKSLHSDTKSYWLLVITIVIAVCMILGLALAAAGMGEKAKDAHRHRAQISLLAPTETQLNELRAQKEVEWMGEYTALGFSYQDDIQLMIAYGDKNYFKKEVNQPIEGHIPKAKDEVMLEEGYLKHCKLNCRPGDVVQLDLTGLGTKKSYILSGITKSDETEQQSYSAYVSKPLAQSIADETLGGHLQITAYMRIATDDIDSSVLMEQARNIAIPLGIDAEQIYLTDYCYIMAGGSMGEEGVLFIPILALIASVLAMVIINGIFHTMVTKNVQTLGQLRTIGMTKRQIRRMVRRQGTLIASKGILLGLVVGTLIGFLWCPSGFRIKTAFLFGVISVIVALCGVVVALHRPSRIAVAISPIEGANYQPYKGQKEAKKLYRKLSAVHMAGISVSRNKGKMGFIVLTLSLSGIVFLSASTIAGSIDAEKQARFGYYPDGDIHIGLKNVERSTFDTAGEYNYSTLMQLENNPLDNSDLQQQITGIKGVRDVTAHDAIYCTITFPGIKSISSFGNYFPTIDEKTFEKIMPLLKACEGDYKDLTKRNGILVDQKYADVGDKLSLVLRGKNGKKQKVEVKVLGTYYSETLMAHAPMVPGKPSMVLSSDMVQSLTGVKTQTGVLSVDVDPSMFEMLHTSLLTLVNEDGRLVMNDITETKQNIEQVYSIYVENLYLVAVILFLFGSIALANIMVVDLQNRRREIGLLKAVGMTQGQLLQMLQSEIRLYLGSALAITVVGSVIASLVVGIWLDEKNHCISFSIPWPFIIMLLVAMLALYIIFSVHARNYLKNTKSLDAIRE